MSSNGVLLNRLKSKGPKRILALDGGGIRGILTLGFLKKIEDILRQRSGNDQLVLSDYFDFIGGTSTGSIIAGALSIGKSVDEISDMYHRLGGEIFKPRLWINKYLSFLSGLFGAQYSIVALNKRLEEVFGDMTLGDEAIKTGLCIIAKRADTRSTWPLINHPEAKYYKYNHSYPLKEIIRASTAAPTKFEPERIQIKKDTEGIFVDGGLSHSNNPALMMFLISTLQCFPFHWKTGADDILLVSVGTGFSDYETQPTTIEKKRMFGWLPLVMDFIMQDVSEMNQIILQSMARTPQPVKIDSEMGDLREENLSGNHLLHYLRYNVQLQKEHMDRVGLSKYNDELGPLHSIEDPANSPKLKEISAAFAEDLVDPSHLPSSFDNWN